MGYRLQESQQGIQIVHEDIPLLRIFLHDGTVIDYEIRPKQLALLIQDAIAVMLKAMK